MDDFKIIMLADDDYLTVKMDSVSVIGPDGTAVRRILLVKKI